MRALDRPSPRTAAAGRKEPVRAVVAAADPLAQRAIAVQREVKGDQDFAAAAADPNRRREAILYLNHPQHAEAARNVKLDLAIVEAMLTVVGPLEHNARGALLERGFAITTKENPNWAKATGFILVLDDPGIARNLGTLSDKEAKLLAKGARQAGRAGDERLMRPLRQKIRKQPGQLFGTVTVTTTAHDGSDHARYSYEARIQFDPDPEVVDATKVAFVQTMSLVKTSGWWPRSQDDRKGVSGRLNDKTQAIDRAPTFKSGWFGQQNDGSFKLSGDGGAQPAVLENGVVKQPAVFLDKPDGKDGDRTWRYETSIIAEDGPDKGFVYAVVRWGFKVDDDLKVEKIPHEIRQVPTGDFATAASAWNAQASSSSPATSGQQALPVLRLLDTGAPPHLPAGREVTAPGTGPPARYALETRDLATFDARSRAQWAAKLQGSAGNQAARHLITPVQRCGGEVHAGCACAEEFVQRQEKGPFGAAREAFLAVEHKAQFDAIQGLAMNSLLPKTAALSEEVRADEGAAQSSGGPRLLAALRAVAARGKPWQAYFEANNAIVAGLPVDQIGDIVQFLGGPKGAAYYPADQIKDKDFGGKFDGSVDPAAGLVTLYFRVRFDADAVRWGPSAPGTPNAERETRDGLAKFQADFKRVVESSWSFKGKIKAACPVGGRPALDTKVVVTVVDSREHTVFHLFSESAEGRSNAAPGEGNLRIDTVEEGKPVTKTVSDPTGRHPTEVTTKQIPAAHEFGHAIGLHHPHCKGGDDNCYGVTAEERRDIMGAGNLLQAIKHGKAAPHDDFGPFEAIARAWGESHLVGASAACNIWTAVP
ncbi:hypothetical protein Psi02_73810 [Planotetraspora silvatica]|uniref:Uncharacterized protein n=1 Tax=Planotetraspora silvatica TaxID=234614 RepID=A0A8J3UTC2_9ACTN|nr:hypothetical protein [Planotetraspora silvatica]GII50957.1 hypothetical protein Psi02_73810 [Planotetraspora silvatica]